MSHASQRMQTYLDISTHLTGLSDENLQQMLTTVQPLHAGIGGKSAVMTLGETPVFVKKIPLTDRERQPENFMATANLFDLPLCYQYGVGSAGFGAWRELAVHHMTTHCVTAGVCVNFPVLYHWRVLPCDPSDANLAYWGDVEKYTQYWENSHAIRQRVAELNKASAHIVLFLEYVPQNLQEWLSAEIVKGGDAAAAAVAFVDENLRMTNAHMSTQGLVHFDAHFANILTDGERLYLSDFGLALSSHFALSTAETEFLQQHQQYDQASAALNLLHCIITTLFGKEQWITRLREIINGEREIPVPVLLALIQCYAPIALVMDAFLQTLQQTSKSAPYPAIHLEQLLRAGTSID